MLHDTVGATIRTVCYPPRWGRSLLEAAKPKPQAAAVDWTEQDNALFAP